MAADPWGEVIVEAEWLKAESLRSLGMDPQSIPLETPPENLGDVAFAVFPIAKSMRMRPDEVAAQVV